MYEHLYNLQLHVHATHPLVRLLTQYSIVNPYSFSHTISLSFSLTFAVSFSLTHTQSLSLSEYLKMNLRNESLGKALFFSPSLTYLFFPAHFYLLNTTHTHYLTHCRVGWNSSVSENVIGAPNVTKNFGYIKWVFFIFSV